MISAVLLETYQAQKITLSKGETLFKKGERAQYFFQIISGSVKMNNYNDEGKEFIQGIFYQSQSFGEPPLFDAFDYPAGAEALETSVLYRLPKERFLKMLEEHPKMAIEITKTIARRLHYKAIMAAEISSEEASHRILTLLAYLKENVYDNQEREIDLTRQQIADLTGLRVETVIRAIKQLKEKEQIKIVNRKIWI